MATAKHMATDEGRRENRRTREDRRKKQMPIPFADRRSGRDRREEGGRNDAEA